MTYETESLTYMKGMIECNESRTYQMYLEHSDTCPNRIYRMICQTENVEIKYSEKNAKLAVCMAVFDVDGKILLTRRNINMKIFPHAWVMPGGHIDLGETLEEGVVRELKEETGIEVERKVSEDGMKFEYFHNE